MALHSEAEVSKDVKKKKCINDMTQLELEELENTYDTGRESLRFRYLQFFLTILLLQTSTS